MAMEKKVNLTRDRLGGRLLLVREGGAGSAGMGVYCIPQTGVIGTALERDLLREASKASQFGAARRIRARRERSD